MGEEADQQEQTKAEVKPEEEKTEELKKKEDPKPPSPFVLFIDLHCVGCAKKIEKSILNNTGVEGVVIDMGENQVTIKGVVEPQAICNNITKKTKRIAKVVSPLPAAEGEPIPQLVASQVSGLTTVELNVNMHCEACALQLKKKILKMKGVRTVETKLSSGRVTVSGTMDGNELVDYVYRRTKKQAKIVPQPEPEKPAPVEEATKPTEAEKPAADEVPKPEEEAAEVEEKKDGGDESKSSSEEKGGENQEEGRKEGGGGGGGGGGVRSSSIYDHEEQGMQRMMYYYEPLYVIERIPPPQLFSDENPNACSIS